MNHAVVVDAVIQIYSSNEFNNLTYLICWLLINFKFIFVLVLLLFEFLLQTATFYRILAEIYEEFAPSPISLLDGL